MTDPTIFYFSGTGNSYWVSKQIQNKFKNFKLVRITKKLIRQNNPVKSQQLGFVFPVYAFGLPRMVHEFIIKTLINKPKYLFAIATHGGNAANTLNIFQKLLSKKSLVLNSAFELEMPGNYIRFSYPIQEKQKKDYKNLLNASEKLQTIISKIQTFQNISPKETTLDVKFSSKFIPFLFNLFYKREDRFFLCSDDCIGCGRCSKICPSENIILINDKKPKWLHNCLFCMACLNWCPENAIFYKNKEKYPNYYHHPDVKASELL